MATAGPMEVTLREMNQPEINQPPACKKSNTNVQYPPFPTLLGEHAVLLSKTADGNAMVTNFRICVCERRYFVNVPLLAIWEVTTESGSTHMKIACKDGSTYSVKFASNDDWQECNNLLQHYTSIPKAVKDIFAFRFYAITTYKESLNHSLSASEAEQIALCQPVSEDFRYTFGKEVERQGFDTNRRRLWRMSHANEEFELCATYPKYHIMPAAIEDAELRRSVDFRALKRFPSVVWRDKKLGVVLIRSSQPLSSFLGVNYFSNHADISLLEKIVEACQREREIIEEAKMRELGCALPDSRGSPATATAGGAAAVVAHTEGGDGAQGSIVAVGQGHGASNGSVHHHHHHSHHHHGHRQTNLPPDAGKLAIVDCRSVAGMWGNSFKGGGTEDEGVYKCTIFHLDLANIHTVRDSFNKMRSLSNSYVEGTYLKSLSGCMWLCYIGALLRGANMVVDLIQIKRRPVLVHCSDGWDRTSQICSLSELMMDKYYRTIEGFQVLVEREWLHFGHKFAERGGHDLNCTDLHQMSPIFLQFLDCVYQLTLQYPAEFQFSEAYLVKLLRHSQAGLFGTFLHNCEKERQGSEKTASVWTLLRPENTQFVNLLYKPKHEILTAKYAEFDIVLWRNVYMAGQCPWLHASQTDFHMESSMVSSGGEDSGDTAAEGISRSKSMENLARVNADGGRRNSDPQVHQNQQNQEPSAASSPAQPAAPVKQEESSSSSHDHHDTSTSSAELLNYPDESGNSGHDTSQTDSACASPSKKSVSDSEAQSEVTTESKAEESAEQITLTLKASAEAANSQDVGETDTKQCANKAVTEGRSGGRSKVHHLGPSSSSVFCGSSEETLSEGNSSSSNEQPLCGQGGDKEGDSKNSPAQLAITTVMSTTVQTGTVTLSHNNLPSSLVEPEVSKNQELSHPSSPSSSVLACGSSTHSAGKSCSADSQPSSPNGRCSMATSLLSERLASPYSHTRTITHLANGSDGSSMQHSKSPGGKGSVGDPDKDSAFNGHLPSPSYAAVASLTSKSMYQNGFVAPPQSESSSSLTDTGQQQQHQSPKILNGSRDDEPHTLTDSTDTLVDQSHNFKLNGSSSSHGSGSSNVTKLLSTNGCAAASVPPCSSQSAPSMVHSALSQKQRRDSQTSLGVVTQVSPPESPQYLRSRRARAASGASRDLSVSPSSSCHGAWADVGRLRHASGGGEVAVRNRMIGATVATSTSDISDSCVGKIGNTTTVALVERGSSIKQHLDVDGLTHFIDERQDLLTELVAEKELKIAQLESQLRHAIDIIRANHERQKQQSAPTSHMTNGHHSALDDLLITEVEGSEPSSMGALSNAASDNSWEAIEETEERIVMWVPDSTVTHCAGCDSEFWLAKRKHHCRNCGKVFCWDCSNYMAPVPHQHLNKPERVCRRCHACLLQLSPGASSDGRIPTLVADG